MIAGRKSMPYGDRHILPFKTLSKTQSSFPLDAKNLCTGAEFQSWRPSLGEVEKNSFIALPGTEQQSRLMPQNCVSQLRRTQFSSVQFSRSVVSDSLRPHESQHARPPCPLPSPGVHSDSLRCHPAISSSVVLFSSCP